MCACACLLVCGMDKKRVIENKRWFLTNVLIRYFDGNSTLSVLSFKLSRAKSSSFGKVDLDMSTLNEVFVGLKQINIDMLT
jgi:hypothetical protein